MPRRSDLKQAVQAELRSMEASIDHYQVAYLQFHQLSQLGEFELAEAHRLNALAWLESSMDLFTRACRIQRGEA